MKGGGLHQQAMGINHDLNEMELNNHQKSGFDNETWRVLVILTMTVLSSNGVFILRLEMSMPLMSCTLTTDTQMDSAETCKLL